jgi:hypothetical protein
VLRVAGALDGDLRRGVFDVAEIVGCQLDLSRADVLFQPL